MMLKLMLNVLNSISSLFTIIILIFPFIVLIYFLIVIFVFPADPAGSPERLVELPVTGRPGGRAVAAARRRALDESPVGGRLARVHLREHKSENALAVLPVEVDCCFCCSASDVCCCFSKLDLLNLLFGSISGRNCWPGAAV